MGKDDDCVDGSIDSPIGSAASTQVDEALRALRYANQAHGISGGDSGDGGGSTSAAHEAAHEAAHVVQQRGGNGWPVNDDDVVVDDLVSGGNGDGDGDCTENPSGVSDNGGGGKEPTREAGTDYNSTRSNTTSVKSGEGHGVPDKYYHRGVSGGGGGGKTREPDAFGYTWMPTITSAVKVITAALLLVTVAAGADIYQTYNDAIAIDLEKHITDADFELSEDKSEISGSVGFDIPEMGLFEKSIIASVHVTVLDSNPTTDGDYEFEYTLGSGEQFYDFTLDDLDPVTVEKIEAGQPLDIEYSGTISVTYLGIEIPSVTMDIPLTTTTVETA